jgi:hypothetical protein
MVRVEIGDLDGPIGIVVANGKRIRYEVVPEKRRYLHGIVASCREGADPHTGIAYRAMEPEQFLREIPHRLHGWTWANVIDERYTPASQASQALQEEL